ncbi:MAG: tetratricopeptide repeat protein [Planctomycetota bacterium]
MSNQHPFTNPDPFLDQGNHVTPRKRGSRWLVVLGVLFGFGFLFCGGILVASYFALEQVAGGYGPVDLPETLPTRIDEQRNFNRSLAGFVADPSKDPCVDPDICEFVTDSLQQLRDYDTIPFSHEMFLQAVAASPLGKGQVGFLERLSIKSWLAEYEPVPYVDEPYERILDMRVNAEGDLATVDLLLYSEESQASSEQWYLVKDDDVWKLYDWNRLEYGRRMSDEYAAYVISESLNADGYDLAVNDLDEAEGLYLEGETERAHDLIRQCETRPMLPSDCNVALLRTAYTWMAIGECEESIRVLKMIPNPDEIWGVWPALAACYSNLGKNEEALEATQRYEKLSPDHPNMHMLYSIVLLEAGRDAEAADHAAMNLRFFPRDQTVLTDLIDFSRFEDIPLLLDCMVECMAESGHTFAWDLVLNHGAVEPLWGQQLVQAAKEHEELPAGFVTLAEANLAWAQSDFDRSAELFLEARNQVQLSVLREIAARDHIDARIKGGNIVALLAEAGDTDVFRSLLADALDDSLDIEPQAIIDALNQADTGDSHWALGLRGFANHQLDRLGDALRDFETFYDWAKNRTVDSAGTDEEVETWVVDAVLGYMIEELVETDRAIEALERWPDEVETLHQWGTLLLQPHQQNQRDAVLAAFPDEASDVAKVQRFRILAQQANDRRESELCDQYHQSAIELARPLYEQSYYLVTLFSQRAQNAVWHRFESVPIDSLYLDEGDEDSDFRGTFFTDALIEANILLDESTAREWIEKAERNGLDNSETLAELHESLADLFYEVGKYEAAAQSYLAAIERTEDRDSWRAGERRRAYINSMLGLHKYDELRNWLDKQDEKQIWDDATVLLKEGDSEALMALLEEQKQDRAIAWLRRPVVRAELDLQRDQNWVDQLLERYTLSFGYRSAASSGSLLLDSDHVPPTEEMRRLVRLLAGSNREVREIDSADETNHSWLVSGDAGERTVVTFQLAQYDASMSPPELSGRLEQPVVRILLQIDDPMPNPTRRLLESSARLVTEKAIAFAWEDHDVLWIGSDLEERLQWKDRVPVETALSQARLTLSPVKEEDDSEIISIDQWNGKLEQSEEKRVSVFVTQRIGGVTERLAAHIVNVDRDQYAIYAELDEDSVLDPLGKKGRRISVGVANLQPRED